MDEKEIIKKTAKQIFKDFEIMMTKNPIDRIYFYFMQWKYERLKAKWMES